MAYNRWGFFFPLGGFRLPFWSKLPFSRSKLPFWSMLPFFGLGYPFVPGCFFSFLNKGWHLFLLPSFFDFSFFYGGFVSLHYVLFSYSFYIFAFNFWAFSFFHLGVVFSAHWIVGFPHLSQVKVGHNMTSLVLNVGYYFHNMAWCNIKNIIKHFMVF